MKLNESRRMANKPPSAFIEQQNQHEPNLHGSVKAGKHFSGIQIAFFRHFLRKISLGGDDGRNICQATFYATKNYRKLIAHFFIHLPAMTGESETKQTVSAFRLSFIIPG